MSFSSKLKLNEEFFLCFRLVRPFVRTYTYTQPYVRACQVEAFSDRLIVVL